MNKHNDYTKRTLGPLSLRAEFQSNSVDAEKRTATIIWSTGAKVRRTPYFDDAYNEELSMEGANIRMARLESGAAPLLNNHSQDSLSNVIGVVERAWIEGGQGMAQVRFSDREDVQPIFQDVRNGILKNISVGYRVYKYEDVSGDDDKLRTLRATDWEPFELSLVAIPADAKAVVRGETAENNDCEIHLKKKTFVEKRGSNMKETEITPAAPTQVDVEAVRKEATELERRRVSDIQVAVRAAKLDTSFADTLVSGGKTADEARKLIIDELAKKTEDTQIKNQVRVEFGGQDEVKTRREAMENAIAHRANPGAVKLTEAGREYRGMSLLEMAKDSLEAQGQRVRGMNKLEVSTRAFHSTSDFPEILANVLNKSLRQGYEGVVRSFVPWARKMSASDFKQISRTQMGDAPKLKKVLEHGEFTRGSVGEGAEKYELATYGRVIAITRQVIINDDLSAFTRVPEMFGRSAADLESDLVYGILTSNPLMADGVALFASGHANLAGAGAAPSVATLSAARLAMRKQKGLGALADQQFINVMAKYLLAPPEHETAAEQILNQLIVAEQVANTNPFSGKMQLIVEPRLSLASAPHPWFLAADPASIDTVEYCYLEGQDGVFIESKQGFDVDGLEVKARLDFATKAIDHRGLYKNPGV